MSYLYPFKAITPTNMMLANLNSLFSLDAQNSDSIEIYENKIKYINSSLETTFLRQKANNFYCCRITNKNKSFVIVGLIALVNTNLVNKKIFRHERCINSKQALYKNLFNKYNTQISPITLMHEDNVQINKSLNFFLKEREPFLNMSDDEYKYEIWPISDYSYYQELYSNVNAFLIADGHHRMSSISSSNNGLIAAFLVSINQAKSADILREYKKIKPSSKKELSNFLSNNLNLIKTTLPKNINLSNGFLCKIDNDVYELSRHQHERIREILEYLDQSINYENGELNFYNCRYDRRNNLMYSKKEIGLLIPAFKSINKIKNSPIYPPHSTLFYPKIPDGLISYVGA